MIINIGTQNRGYHGISIVTILRIGTTKASGVIKLASWGESVPNEMISWENHRTNSWISWILRQPIFDYQRIWNSVKMRWAHFMASP